MLGTDLAATAPPTITLLPLSRRDLDVTDESAAGRTGGGRAEGKRRPGEGDARSAPPCRSAGPGRAPRGVGKRFAPRPPPPAPPPVLPVPSAAPTTGNPPARHIFRVAGAEASLQP